MNDDIRKGQALRADDTAKSINPELPVFIARPTSAPIYYGFPLLSNSEADGFMFGTITEPKGSEPAEWGDAFVVAPNGSRAGIIWQTGDGEPYVVCEPSEGRWGVYGFHFKGPITSDAELVAHLRSILPKLKEFYRAAAVSCPESIRPVAKG